MYVLNVQLLFLYLEASGESTVISKVFIIFNLNSLMHAYKIFKGFFDVVFNLLQRSNDSEGIF